MKKFIKFLQQEIKANNSLCEQMQIINASQDIIKIFKLISDACTIVIEKVLGFTKEEIK